MKNKRKKWANNIESGLIIYQTRNVKVVKDSTEIFYESKINNLGLNFITNDIAEAVAGLMKIPQLKCDEIFWNMEVSIIDKYVFNIDNVLYWLSGGYKEWDLGERYLFTWKEVSYLFQEEFEKDILNVIKNSKTLGDIRKGFNEKMNLPIMYEFAIKNKLI